METMRGKGWRVLPPPSIAMPKVFEFFNTRTSTAVGTGTGEGDCWETKQGELRKIYL